VDTINLTWPPHLFLALGHRTSSSYTGSSLVLIPWAFGDTNLVVAISVLRSKAKAKVTVYQPIHLGLSDGPPSIHCPPSLSYPYPQIVVLLSMSLFVRTLVQTNYSNSSIMVIHVQLNKQHGAWHANQALHQRMAPPTPTPL
jgi:hypothetical protein